MHVQVARQQGGHLGGRIRDEAERGLVHLDGGRVAVLGPLGQRHRGALVPALELVGAGAHRFGGVGVGALGLDQDGRGLPHQEQEVRVELLVDHDHGVLVHDADALHRGERALVLVGALFAGGALKRELDRVGIEGLAVLELDALAQLEGVGLEVGRDFPALGQQRRDAAVGVDSW
jgi:hypothetical protein